jgi:3-oxoadipate enol-lactonase
VPRIKVNDTELHYEDTGGSGEPILFSHGLLWNVALFAPQMAALKDRYRCIAYDHRGQGQSADDPRKVIDMDLLTQDAVALIKALSLGPVHFCGLSMGGFVGMRLAARHPSLVRSLILCDTSSEPEPPENAPRYARMNVVARWLGPRLVVPKVMPILFGKTSLSDPTRSADRAEWLNQLNKNRRSIWRAVNGVIHRAPVTAELANIRAPTLVIVGDEDVATIPAKARRIVEGISNARLVVIPGAGHSSSVEQPAAVTAAIEDLLQGVSAGA